MAIHTNIEHSARVERDRTLTRAFEGGNYANAYEGDDYSKHAPTIAGFSADYRVAFILGFFATYEKHEIPAYHLDAYLDAEEHPAAQRLRELGILDRCFLTPQDVAALDGTSGANA